MRRGEIRSPKLAEQIKDYSNLAFDTITPTDIDGIIDFGNKLWVIIELKFKGGKMPYGQKLCLERLCDIIEETGRKSMLIKAFHETPPELPIDVGNLVIDEYRINRTWRRPNSIITVRTGIERFLEWA